MSFVLSKLFWLVARPSNLLVLLLLLGVLLRQHGRWLVAAVALGLALVSVVPVGRWLLVPLENRFPVIAPPERVDGVIVLGGGVDPRLSGARAQPATNDAGERQTTLVSLARRYPEATIVFTGGNGSLAGAPVSEADVVRALLDEIGFDAERVTFEGRSRNTWENALFSRDLVRPEDGARWLLVTSAFHMPRAVGIFRRVGWEVIPYPVDFRSRGGFALEPDVAVGQRLYELDLAAKEYVGLVAYWLMGRTSALWP